VTNFHRRTNDAPVILLLLYFNNKFNDKADDLCLRRYGNLGQILL